MGLFPQWGGLPDLPYHILEEESEDLNTNQQPSFIHKYKQTLTRVCLGLSIFTGLMSILILGYLVI